MLQGRLAYARFAFEETARPVAEPVAEEEGGRPRDPEPQDPYAYVTAPKKPRPPCRSGAAVAELDE
jgi:hypothetical protein